MNHMPDLTVHRGTGAWTRRQVLTAGGAVAVTLLAGCRPAEPSAGPVLATPSVALPTPTPAVEAQPLEIAPDLRRKLAQMVLVGFRGTVLEADNPIVADIRDRVFRGEAQRWAYVTGYIAFVDDENPEWWGPLSREQADKKIRQLLKELAEEKIDWDKVR